MLNSIDHILMYCSIVLLVLALALVLLTAILNKNIFIRLLVLEVIANMFICGIAIYALMISFPSLLDICIALSLIAFLSTAAYCQYIINRRKDNA